MPGKEILANGSANLGLLDQRLGLEWVRILAKSSISLNKKQDADGEYDTGRRQY